MENSLYGVGPSILPAVFDVGVCKLLLVLTDTVDDSYYVVSSWREGHGNALVCQANEAVCHNHITELANQYCRLWHLYGKHRGLTKFFSMVFVLLDQCMLLPIEYLMVFGKRKVIFFVNVNGVMINTIHRK